MINQARRSTQSLTTRQVVYISFKRDSERIQKRESDWFSCLENRSKKKTGFLTQKSDKKMLLSGFGVNQPMMYNFHKSNSAGKDLVKEASVKVPAAACTEDCPKGFRHSHANNIVSSHPVKTVSSPNLVDGFSIR